MKPKIVVIVGPTASGKTSLSIALAHKFNGEVVSADSRQVYRGLNLGSGKVTKEEMDGVPHHLLDVADPKEVYTASDFKRDAERAVEEIIGNSRLPIIAGGTFMYVDALLGRISLPGVPPNEALREKLVALDNDTLLEQLEKLDPSRAETVDRNNPRRLIRAIEIATALGHVPVPELDEPYDALMLGITLDQETLHHNIHVRLLERLEAGMVAEIENLIASGVAHDRLEDLGLEYRYVSRYLRGELNYDTMVTDLETKIRQFAKRQMTWLKRDASIHWINKENVTEIETLVTNFLNN